MSFGIETLCVTGSCEFNIYMSPEARKSELRQIATAQHAEAHLTAVSKQVSEGFGILGAAMTKFGALTESELQQLTIIEFRHLCRKFPRRHRLLSQSPRLRQP